MGLPAISEPHTSVSALVERLSDSNQDFEWYPTTDAMLDVIEHDMRKRFQIREGDAVRVSVLDCGAGDGRVLKRLTQGDRYAIEKARPLLDNLDRSIFVVGTDFHAQTLIDKSVCVLFSNPPYSQFSSWTVKILQEARAQTAYLIIPQRWKNDRGIQSALAARKATATVLSETDFLDAPRRARARVQILRVDFAAKWSGGHDVRCRVDPFELWFEEHFPLNVSERSRSEYDIEQAEKDKIRREVIRAGELIESRGLVTAIELFYQREMEKLTQNYLRLCDLDEELLSELDVNLQGIKAALKLKIRGLKNAAWEELFNNLSDITDRLTSDSRSRLLETLTRNTHVDFSTENAHAIVIWAIKNSNHYLDQQLVELVENMVNRANIRLYASNQRTFGNEQWRYGRRPDSLTRYALDYRIVLHHVGGISTSAWSFERTACGLQGRAVHFLDDLLTVAANLGFDTRGTPKAGTWNWSSGSKVVFHYADHGGGQAQMLMEVKAFKNGNLHLKLNQAFIQRLNIEFGRLKGWLKSAEEAYEEMGVDRKVATDAFGSNVKLGHNEALKRLGKRL